MDDSDKYRPCDKLQESSLFCDRTLRICVAGHLGTLLTFHFIFLGRKKYTKTVAKTCQRHKEASDCLLQRGFEGFFSGVEVVLSFIHSQPPLTTRVTFPVIL